MEFRDTGTWNSGTLEHGIQEYWNMDYRNTGIWNSG
jgi:hypothetical protein